MSFKLITSPFNREFRESAVEKWVFLGGGIQKCPDWQSEIAAVLEGSEASAKKQDVPKEEAIQAAEEEAPAKVWTLEEVRGILAEKSRTGYRAEVKAILTAHGVRQLSEITDPEELAAVVAEAEVIGNA